MQINHRPVAVPMKEDLPHHDIAHTRPEGEIEAEPSELRSETMHHQVIAEEADTVERRIPVAEPVGSLPSAQLPMCLYQNAHAHRASTAGDFTVGRRVALFACLVLAASSVS